MLSKIRNRDAEITRLHRIHDVHLDDLSELIKTSALPKFDHGAARNTAIRTMANLQMEQKVDA